LPYIALGAFYLDVLAWRLRLGTWPRYGYPDAGALHGLVLVADIAVFLALALATVSAFFVAPAALASIRAHMRWLRLPVCVWAFGCLVLFLLIRSDPGGFFDWFAD
jgi:hypothetical protein